MPGRAYIPPAGCAARAPAFWAQVDIPERAEAVPVDRDCWLWTGRVRADGQAFFYLDGRQLPIHRYLWLLKFGELEDGQVARPTCGTPLCVNPHHIATRSAGQRCALDAQKKRDIHALRAHSSPMPISHLARLFGVSPTTIRRVLKEPAL